MASKAFWPGFRWRILAHERLYKDRASSYTGEQCDVRSGWDRHPIERADKTIEDLAGLWEFDELVIDDWFHLEQMDDRHWWLGVGNGDDYWHVNVSVDRDGKATIQMEKQS